MNNIKVAVVIIFVFVLAVALLYFIYLKQITKSESLSLPPFGSPSANFPSATESASPKTADGNSTKQPGQVAGTSAFPSSQPETGIGQTLTGNAGIEILAPQAQEQISSPVFVSGLANVPNNLVVEVRNANGQILGLRKTKACFGYQACPFSVSIVFSTPQTAGGQITAYSPPLSGNTPEYQEAVNVTFK